MKSKICCPGWRSRLIKVHENVYTGILSLKPSLRFRVNKIEEIFLVVSNAYEDDDDEYDDDDDDDDNDIQFKDFKCFLHLFRTCETAVLVMNFFSI